jgi:hypothetical protein
MNISFLPFTEEWIPQVQAFNRRMLEGGLDPQLTFPEDPAFDYSRRPQAPLWQEGYLAVEDGVVRGAYYFTHERYLVNGSVRWIAHYRHPISEVVVNKAYKGLASRLLADARSRQPDLYGSGFGGENGPNLRRLRAEGWSHVLVPFWFLVTRPAVFLRNIQALRKSPARRFALDLAAATGIGSLGIHAVQALRAIGGGHGGGSLEENPDFGTWADELWEVNRPLFLFAAVRDHATLNLRYPPENSRLRRLVLSAGGRCVGWAVTLEKQMHDNPYFGNMRVGSIVDCLAVPGQECALALAAAGRLRAAGVDIVVTNQSAQSWCDAFRRAGFFSGPSNYPFAVSPDLAAKLHPFTGNRAGFHFTRGDGAGASRL